MAVMLRLYHQSTKNLTVDKIKILRYNLIVRYPNYMKDELNDKIIGTMFKVFKAMKDTMSFNSKSSHLTMVQFEALIVSKTQRITHERFGRLFFHYNANRNVYGR